MNIDYKLIGGRIKAERNRRGLTQENLAEKLDVSVGYVSQIERGVTKISLDTLAEISNVLKCDIAKLITGTVIGGENYMSAELNEYYASLDKRDRQLLSDFIKLLARRM